MLTLPRDDKESERLLASFHRLKGDTNFQIIVEFLEAELSETDKKLRRPSDNYLQVAGHAQLLERFLELSERSSELLKDLRERNGVQY
jgi:hypothetical protein